METNLSRSFITCLEWMRICVGFVLIVWSGNEYLHDLHCLLGVETNLCRICIACLEWMWMYAGFLLIACSENESVQDLYCLFGVERSCAWFLLLAWSVNESVQVIYCLFMSVSALGIQLFCWILAYYVLVTSYALDFQRHMLWSSMIWFEVGGCCFICWYLWYCWPSLSTTTFQNCQAEI